MRKKNSFRAIESWNFAIFDTSANSVRTNIYDLDYHSVIQLIFFQFQSQ